MADTITKHAFGNKANLEGAISGGTINEFDEVFLTDTHEMGYVDSSKTFHMVTPRTQAEITVMGNSNIGSFKPNDKIPAGTSLEEFIKKLVQVQVPPTYSQPTITLAKYDDGTASGTLETGTTVNPKMTATFTQRDAGALTKIVINKGGSPVEGAESATSPYDYTGDSFVLGDETVTFTATATYAEGEIKNDNLGAPYPEGHIAAGSKTSSNYSFTGARKSFWGSGVGSVPALTSDVVRGLTGSQLNLGNGNKEIAFNAGTQYIVFAVPANKKLTKVRYNEGNDDAMLPNFETETVQVADARGGENGLTGYTVYKYAAAAPSASTMTFVFTVANA